MNVNIIYDFVLSLFLIVVLFVNIYFTFKLNRKIKELKLYTKKLPELTAYVQKTMEAFGKSLVDLRDSSENIQITFAETLEKAEDIKEDLHDVIKEADKKIRDLETSNASVGKIHLNQKESPVSIQLKKKINSVLDLIDNR